MTNEQAAGRQVGIARRILGRALQLLGAVALAIIATLTAFTWREPRITAEVHASSTGHSSSSSMIGPNPRMSGMIVLGAALTISVGMLLLGLQLSLRRLLIGVFVVGAIAAVLSSGVTYAPTQGNFSFECRKGLRADEMEQLRSALTRAALTMLSSPRELVSLTAIYDGDGQRVLATIELAPTVADDKTREILAHVEQLTQSRVYEMSKYESN